MAVRTVVVRNLATGAEVTYTNDLPVETIVRNAYLQMEKRDYNFWQYDQAKHPPIEHGRNIVACGDWVAFVDGHRFQSMSSQ